MDNANYQHGSRGWQELAECGQYEQAFELVSRHLVRESGDLEALNDAGTILFCLGRSADAIGYLEKAARLAQGDKAGQILWNLCEAYLQDGRCAEAAGLFERMEGCGVLNVDVLNRTANAFLNKGALGGAIEILLRSLAICSEQEILQPMVEIIRHKRPRVGVVSGMAGPAGRLVDWLSKRFVVELCEGQSFSSVCQTVENCGISVFYGCDESLIRAGHRDGGCGKVSVLHSEDIYGDELEHICWQEADEIVAVGGPRVVDLLRERAGLSGQKPRITTADEAADMERCAFTLRVRGKRLAALGPFDARSNVMFLLQCIQKLRYIDGDYKLYLGGEFSDRMVEEYVRSTIDSLGLEGAVFLDGPVANEVSWLKDKHYFVSVDISGARLGRVWSAMACGLKPVVHRFAGADEVFDKEFLFNISEQFCSQIQNSEYEPRKYRRFVEQRQKQFSEFKAVNDALMRIERRVILSGGAEARSGAVGQPNPRASEETSGRGLPHLPWERMDAISPVGGREQRR